MLFLKTVLESKALLTFIMPNRPKIILS